MVKVQNGEKISQYQALQAMLLPSGNNMADSMARWAFGARQRSLLPSRSASSRASLSERESKSMRSSQAFEVHTRS